VRAFNAVTHLQRQYRTLVGGNHWRCDNQPVIVNPGKPVIAKAAVTT
jgi:hypothetical protein